MTLHCLLTHCLYCLEIKVFWIGEAVSRDSAQMFFVLKHVINLQLQLLPTGSPLSGLLLVPGLTSVSVLGFHEPCTTLTIMQPDHALVGVPSFVC